jgi:phosphatidylglycerol:prolipoprotein diacylglycerol transferase
MYPELQIGSWSISTYFLTISLVFSVLFVWLKIRSQKFGLSTRLALDVGILSSIGGLLGARAFHVVYEAPQFYLQHPEFIFKLWQGGYVFMGGVLLGSFIGLLWLHYQKAAVYPWLDLFAPIVSLGYALGRWACFFQGCCYGKKTDSLWGVHFEVLKHAGEDFARYPTQLFASFGELVVFFTLLLLEKKKSQQLKPGQLFSLWLIGHGINRMFMEVLRDDPRGPLYLGFGISFWISAAALIVGVFIYVKRRSALKPRSM